MQEPHLSSPTKCSSWRNFGPTLFLGRIVTLTSSSTSTKSFLNYSEVHAIQSRENYSLDNTWYTVVQSRGIDLFYFINTVTRNVSILDTTDTWTMVSTLGIESIILSQCWYQYPTCLRRFCDLKVNARYNFYCCIIFVLY